MANEQSPETYAQAIFEQATADWLTPLKNVAECLPPDKAEQLDQPGLAFSKKQEILNQLIPASAPRQVQNFLALLATHNNIHLLPGIIAAFDRFSQRGPIRDVAVVTSAIPLSDSEKTALEGKMRARFGQDTSFEYAQDPDILGGVIVRMGDKVIDGSVSGKLAALKEKLK